MKFFAIFDRAIEAYGNPFLQPTANGAVRMIKNSMKDEGSQLSQTPTDFELWELGDYDEQTGMIAPNQVRVARLEDLVEKQNAS